MMSRFNPLTLCSILLAFGLMAAMTAPPAHSTTLMWMSLPEMSQRAPVIVRARCLANSTGWDAGEIWTLTNFEITETWRGSASGRIRVRLLGGKVGNLTSSVSSVPRFRPGEEVVLFLEPTKRGDYSVVGWQEGTFRIRRDAHTGEENATQDTASLATFNPQTRRFETNGVRNLPVDSLRKQVDAALRLPTSPKR
jgi:hypothetical protein